MIDVYVNGTSIDVGRQGENLARNIYFDLSDLIDTYGEGPATLVHMRPSDKAPYVCTVTRSDTFLIWAPTSTDTAYSGSGKCELRWVVGETLAKSIIYNTSIAPSITADTELPDPYQSWIDAMDSVIIEHADSVLENALEAYLEGNSQELGTLTLNFGGTVYTYDGTSDVTITIANADTTSY